MEIIILGMYGTVKYNGTLSSVDASSQNAWESQYVDVGDIDGTANSIEFGDQIAILLYRDPTASDDDYASDAVLLFTFGCHYEVDGFGSRQEYVD